MNRYEDVGVCVVFPLTTVTTPANMCFQLQGPTIGSALLMEDEVLISKVIQLQPIKKYSEVSKEKVKVALRYSCPDLRGYEVVIRASVNKERNEWKDLETRNVRKPSGKTLLGSIPLKRGYSLIHVAMVAKFLADNKLNTSLKKRIRTTFINLIEFHLTCQMLLE